MRDKEYLDLMITPTYNLSAFRYFLPHERHIQRISKDDVILLMLDGVLRFEEDGRKVDLRKGQWYIQHAGGAQTGLRESDNPVYFYIHCFVTYTKDQHNVLPLTGKFNPQALLPFLNALSQCNDYTHGLLERYIYFFQILTHLADAEQSVKPNSILCSEFVAFIDANFRNDISLSDLEKQFSYSKDHIIRIFKQFYRITPYQYLIQLRIDYAKKLLSTGTYNMTEIASECGFNDITSFHRSFTKQTGQTPSCWQEEVIGSGVGKRKHGAGSASTGANGREIQPKYQIGTMKVR